MNVLDVFELLGRTRTDIGIVSAWPEEICRYYILIEYLKLLLELIDGLSALFLLFLTKLVVFRLIVELSFTVWAC